MVAELVLQSTPQLIYRWGERRAGWVSGRFQSSAWWITWMFNIRAAFLWKLIDSDKGNPVVLVWQNKVGSPEEEAQRQVSQAIQSPSSWSECSQNESAASWFIFSSISMKPMLVLCFSEGGETWVTFWVRHPRRFRCLGFLSDCRPWNLLYEILGSSSYFTSLSL